MHSPLGRYAETIAAGVAVLVIGAAILSRPLAFQDPFLDTLAGIGIGAVFGSTATANGVKVAQGVIIDKLDTAATVATDRAMVRNGLAPTPSNDGGDDTV